MTPLTPTLDAPVRDRSLIGTVLAERYDLRTLLARGGMGEVYEAFDRRLGREVAIKVLHENLAADARFLSRFRREARTAASLSHPGIVSVHDFGIDPGTAFIVMELVHGTTLARVVAERGSLPAREAANIAASIADALAYAHRLGVVHHDVSPGNVMVTSTGVAKLFDFGIARVEPRIPGPEASNLTSQFGTAAYVPPEQARGERGDARSDVYGLGAVTYEALTGHPPFEAGTVETIVSNHLEAAPRHLAAFADDVPRALAAVVMRCLEKDPDDRWPRVAELAAALRRSIDSAPDHSMAPGIGATVAAAPPSMPARPDEAPATIPIERVLITLDLETRPREPRTTPLADRDPARRGVRWPRRLAVAAGAVSAVLLTWLVIVPVWSALSAPPIKRAHSEARPLEAPTGLAAAGACDGWLSTQVALAWTPVSGRADGYEVYRAAELAGPFESVGRVRGAGSSAFVDVDTGVGTTYRYVVRATADDGRIGPVSDEVVASTPLVCLG